MTAELATGSDLARAGYMKWAGDWSGRTYLAPDGHRLLSEAEALRELDQRTAEEAK